MKLINYCYRISDILTTYKEAMESSDAHEWRKAMEEEMESLRENDCFELTKLPEGKPVVGGRWIYAVKLGPKNEERFKARFVAKGLSQIKNINFTDTFSPTANITSIRMLMQIAVNNNFIIHQMDVKTAYLNADIDHEIYMHQPEGFVVQNNQQLVYKLKKSLYGLK